MSRPNMMAGLLLAGLLVTPAAGAVSLEPGQWTMKVSIEMPMLPAPQERSHSECFEKSEFSPEDFQMDEDSPCTISNVQNNADSISWDIACPQLEGEANGHMEFVSHGDSIEGKGHMTMSMAGQTMDMNMTWSGERTGDCAAAD